MNQNSVDLDFYGNPPIRSIDGHNFFSLGPIGFSNHAISKSAYLLTLKTNYITKGNLREDGRYQPNIKNDEGKYKHIYLSNLVARIFLGPPPTTSHTVDHINRNPSDDRLENLRWATKTEQSLNKNKQKDQRGKYITQIDKDTGFEIITWLSIKWAAENINNSRATRNRIWEACCNGTLYNNYFWKYSMNMLPGELWMQVRALNSGNNFYVSNLGRVITPKFTITYGSLTDYGYRRVSIDKIKIEVHRLVMLAFCGQDTRYVNHKDGNKRNNKLENLEYVTPLENSRHALNMGLYKPKYGEENHNSKVTIQMDLDGNVLNEFPSSAEAARHVNVSATLINKVCRGKGKTAAGFRWKYKF